MPRAAIYRRVSGPDDPRQVSLDEQLEACKAVAQREKYKDYDVFTDNFSGAYLYERPHIARLREAYKVGSYDAVIVYCIDRLSRKQGHQALLFEEMETSGVRLISATEDLDNSPEGQLIRNIRGYVAEVERLKIMERTGGAKRRLRAAGLIIPQGKAKLGYRYEDRTRVVVPEEAEVVVKIFTLASEGHSAQGIAKILNEEGVPTPSQWKGRKLKLGNPRWRHDVVYEILRDPSYTGTPMVQGKSRLDGKIQSNGRRPQVDAPANEWSPTSEPTPQIVTPHLWKKANTKKKTADKTRNLERPRLLRGVITCGVCGRKMTVSGSYNHPTRGDKLYYACTSKFKHYRSADEHDPCGNALTPASWADEEAWSLIRESILDWERLEPVLRRQWEEQQGADLTPDRRLHEVALAKAENTIERLVTSFAQADDPAIIRAIKGEIERLSVEAQAHREAIIDIDARMGERTPWEAVQEVIDFVKEQREKLDKYPNPPFDVKRKVVEVGGFRVVARGRELRLERVVKAAPSCS